eukprot:scaffold38017_cov72-Cyclotella_meneghiniana.AAC.17
MHSKDKEEHNIEQSKVVDKPMASQSSRPRSNAFPSKALPLRRLRADSGSMLAQDALSNLSEAEINSIIPPHPIYKIVMTGGPCGGKTTCLERLKYKFVLVEVTHEVYYLHSHLLLIIIIICDTAKQYKTKTPSPEAFTLMVSNGMPFSYLGAVTGMPTIVQDTVMDIQIGLEDGFERLLRARGKPGVLLCDRGLMDGAAYMSPEEWDTLIKKRDVDSVSELREGRYNAVYHMVTAAEGAEQYYTLENNAVRTETPELARTLDHQTRKAWVGHPNLKIFDNSTSFEMKLQRVVEELSRLVGLPHSLEKVSTKFLVRGGEPDLDRFPEDVDYQIFEVEKAYVHNEGRKKQTNVTQDYSFIRKRSMINKIGEEYGSVYGFASVQKTSDGQTIETKRIITKREYNSLFNSRDMGRHVVIQKRISFIWKMQSFNVHVYKKPVDDVCIMHAQKSGGDEVEIPPFLDVDRRITDLEEDEKYGSYQISLKK